MTLERQDLPPYEMLHGPINSPTRYVDFCVYQGRRLGKTNALVAALPNEPIHLVCHTRRWGEEIKRKIRESRPDYDVKNITIIPYNSDMTEMWAETRGMKARPVYVDNDVLDMIQYEYVESLNKMFNYGIQKPR